MICFPVGDRSGYRLAQIRESMADDPLPFNPGADRPENNNEMF